MSEKTELMEGQLWSFTQPNIRTNICKMKLTFIRLKAQCFNEGGFTGSYKGLPEVGILKDFWDVQGVGESRKQTGIYKIYCSTNFCTVLLDACNTTLLLCNLSEFQNSPSYYLCSWNLQALVVQHVIPNWVISHDLLTTYRMHLYKKIGLIDLDLQSSCVKQSKSHVSARCAMSIMHASSC
jgi:hypothetical protein